MIISSQSTKLQRSPSISLSRSSSLGYGHFRDDREEVTIPYYAFRMKIKYALVKVLMLVGDVRNAMVAMGTSGTKDVLANLPDDDALQAKDEVFRPIFSVARKEGNLH
jgi:hypothetical protein